MKKIIVNGGNKLKGRIKVSGAKNAVLPIIIATILGNGKSRILDTPDLSDVHILKEILEELGAKVEFKDNSFEVNAESINKWETSYENINRMRASILVMGPLLAKFGKVKVSLPGGCAIGTRPIDLHLKGFEILGAKITMDHGSITASCDKLVGDKIYLDFPSVGATENIMMAAAMAQGTTVIENAAEEPEIVDLANFLNAMGADIKGAGTSLIKIQGKDTLNGAEHNVIPDRIEAGTYLVAGALLGEEVIIENVISEHIKPLIAKLHEAGVEISEEGSTLRVKGADEIKSTDIKTLPYPGFPTDMQAQLMALMCFSKGTSLITETVFENRFMHVDELKRMGANIKVDGRSSVVEGVAKLEGCPVKATDLRAGAALVIAALKAEGKTEITDVYHIYRGYENLIAKLKKLGADIEEF